MAQAHIQRNYTPTAEHMHMVDNQLRTAGVFDENVIDAFIRIPRALFVSPAAAAIAYSDAPIPVAAHRSLMVPLVLAKILQKFGNVSGKSVLILGAATGYSAALLTAMGARVTAAEVDAVLSAHADAALKQCGIDSIRWVQEPLTALQLAEQFDCILLEGSVHTVPSSILSMLSIGGQLITIIGSGHVGSVMHYIRTENAVSKSVVFEAAASVLPGFEAPSRFVF